MGNVPMPSLQLGPNSLAQSAVLAGMTWDSNACISCSILSRRTILMTLAGGESVRVVLEDFCILAF